MIGQNFSVVVSDYWLFLSAQVVTFESSLAPQVFQEKDNLHCFLEDVSLLNGMSASA